MKKISNDNGHAPFKLRKIYKAKLFSIVLVLSFFQIQANSSYTINNANFASVIVDFQTKFQVQGTIKDASGQPLPGASIIEQGTTNGTTADFDGNFTLNVASENAVLQVSYLGFVNQNVEVKGQTQIDIVLEEDLATLDEVIVVGFGTKKKESVVGSITQAKGEEILRAGAVTTVSEALSGIMPGVSTTQAAGQPGSTAANILIRGAGSFAGSQSPLFLVDGVERDFNNLDPNEIESISVLKDASATAVFGVKGANGVILVTTKRGKAGQTQINVTSSFGLKEPTIDTNYYADYATRLEAFNQAALNDYRYDLLVPQSEIDIWRDPNRDPRFYTFTSWVDELLTTGTNSQHNVNISGGNEFVTYFTSLGYQYDGDIFDYQKQADFDPRTYQNKFTWRSNLDFNFSESTKFQANLAGQFLAFNGNQLTQATNNGVATGGGDIFSRVFQTPLEGPMPILPDGRLTTIPNAVVNPNFYRIQRAGEWNRNDSTLFTDFTLIQNITPTFKASAKVSYNYTQNYRDEIQVNNLLFWGINPLRGEPGEPDFLLDDDANAVDPLPNVTNERRRGYSNTLYYELRLNYDETFGEDHNVGLMGLFNRRRFQNTGFYTFPQLEEAWIARATYDYKSKYLFEFNGAYNGSENWAPGLRFGFFPSLAVGWVVSKEDFFGSTDGFLNFLKFRYSYGEVGRDNVIPAGSNIPERFQYQNIFEVQDSGQFNSFFGDPTTSTGALIIEGFSPNAANTWETAIKQDLGVEFRMLNNQLSATIELFNERREGILMRRNTVVPWFGNSSPLANIGETKSQGIDLEVRWNSSIGKDFTYFFRGNMSITDTRIVERDDPAQAPPNQQQAGKPIGWRGGLLTDGLYRSWDDVYNSPASGLEPSLSPGSFNYVDYNADGVINNQDYVAIGNPSLNTKNFALQFGFTYKNFSAHALFNGAWGLNRPVSSTYLFEYEAATESGFHYLNNEMRDAWSPSNPNGSRPALSTQGNQHDTEFSDYQWRDAAFIRFKTFEVKYRIPQDILKKINVFKTFEIFANGNNLATWTDLPGAFDPEQQVLQVYPITKRYNLGVRLSF